MMTCRTCPTSPSRMARLSASALGSKRRLKPTSSGTGVFFRLAEAAVDLGDVQVDRLLAQHGLARGRRLLDEIDVRVGGRTHDDRVDVLACNQVLRLRGPFTAVLLRQGPGPRLERVDDSYEARARMAGDVACVDLADATGADDSDAQHGSSRKSRPAAQCRGGADFLSQPGSHSVRSTSRALSLLMEGAGVGVRRNSAQSY